MNFAKKIKEIYEYRHMLYTLVKQDVKGKYKGSFLGFFWTLLNPLLLLAVYSIVFQFIFKNNIKYYPIYLFVSLIPWNTFSNNITMGTISITNNANLLKKVYFPREVLPLASVIANVITYFYSAVIILVALVFFCPIGLSLNLLWLPVIVLVQAIFTYACVLVLSGINVYFRDIQYIVNVLMMVWFYATPILYNVDMIPQRFVKLYRLNPMVAIIESYQNIMYSKTAPDFMNLGIIFVVSIVGVVIASLIFNKLQRGFAEEV